MKAALDVHYSENRGAGACVVFENWLDSEPVDLIRIEVPATAAYRPGRFYERELPCLLGLLEKAGRQFDAIVIDGFVHLRPDVGKGLGAHLYESLGYATRIIGVAKNPLRIADRFIPIYRGGSVKPLFISATGCPLAQAAEIIKNMHGPYRIPTLLRAADQYAKHVSPLPTV